MRLTVNESHRLTLADVDQLNTAYTRGTSQAELARTFYINVQTVNTHFRRHGITIRPVHALTTTQEQEAVRLYTDEAWTLREIATKFHVSSDTVRRALLKHGVTMRPRSRRPKR